MIKCLGNHVFDPGKKGWECPECGSKNLVIEFQEEKAHEDCCRLHKYDGVKCDDCEEEWDGFEISRIFEKKLQFVSVKCPHCKGKGYISKRRKK